MLLLLISFYVHYGLLNCEEIVKAKFNKSLLIHHHRQKLLQVNDLLEDLENKTRKLYVLLEHDQPYDTRRKTYFLRSVISEKDQSNQKPENSTEPAQFNSFAGVRAPASAISPDPGVTPDPRSPPPFFKAMISTYPGLKRSPSSLSKDPGLYTSSFLSSLSTTGPRRRTPQVSSTPKTLGPNAQGWLDEIAPYTHSRKKIKKTATSRNPLSVMNKHKSRWSSSSRWSTRQQVIANEDGALNVTKDVSTPGQTTGDPYSDWTSRMTTAGDVLYGKIKVKTPTTTLSTTKNIYQELMRQLGEGQLVVFGIEMFRLIAVKDKREVREVLAPAESIYRTSLESGYLIGVDNPFLTILGNLATMMSEDGVETLRTYSSMMFHTLLKRKEMLSDEVNSLIDQAGLSYTDAEGKRLLCSVSHFEDYPNTNKSSFSICESLIEGILQPFRRPAGSKRRQELLNSINKALRKNYPQLLRARSVGTSTKLSLIETTILRIGTQPRRKRKKKHHHHKKKKKRKRILQPEYYNEQTRPNSQHLDYNLPSFIEAITTKSYRTQRNRKPTNAFLSSKQRPMNAFLSSKQKPMNDFLSSKQRPTNAFLWSKQRPMNAFLWSEQTSTNAFLRSKQTSTNAFLRSKQTSTNDFLWSKQRSTNAFLYNNQTKRIGKRKLVRHRNKQRRHARAASRIDALKLATRSIRTPRYQEAPILGDMVDSKDQEMYQVLRKQFIN